MIDGADLRIIAYIYCHDFPEVGEAIRAMDMGMSFELVDCHVRNMLSEVWSIDRLTFSGAAILLRLKAAYHRRASGSWSLLRR